MESDAQGDRSTPRQYREFVEGLARLIKSTITEAPGTRESFMEEICRLLARAKGELPAAEYRRLLDGVSRTMRMEEDGCALEGRWRVNGRNDDHGPS